MKASPFTRPDSLLQEAVGNVFPAAQLVVVEGGATVLERAVGACDGDTLFDIASLTKPLATTLLTMLHPRITMDTQVRTGIVVRQLLSHSSGLPAWKPLGSDPVAAAAREPLEYPTGSKSVYSDLGFILLGAHLSRELGAPLSQLFAEHIAKPLTVGTTYAPDPGRCAPAEGMRGVVHDENARAIAGGAGHAGLFSTARDVSKIVAAHFDEAFVPRATVEQFWTPRRPGSTWCLGWDRPSPGASQAGSRWPRDGVGHLGFTGCSIWIDPPKRRWVVLLSNRVEPTRANERIKQFRPLLHDAIVDALD